MLHGESMYKIFTYEPDCDCLGTIVLLVGRGGKAIEMMDYYREYCELDKTRLIAMEPFDEWYPAPRSPEDQEDAICGLKVSIPEFDSFISELEIKYSTDRSKIALSGFSAGAVMAIQVATYSAKPFAAVISHNGAILNPDSLPMAVHDTPMFLIHSKDDKCFDWHERYLPMKKSLMEKEYTVELCEKEEGDHSIDPKDVADAAIFLANIFQYPQEWTHSFQHKE